MPKQHGDGFTDADREAVLEALAIEQRLKHEGKPYSEGVITACEVCLRVFARKPHPVQAAQHETPPQAQNWGDTITINDPELKEAAKEYWWNKD